MVEHLLLELAEGEEIHEYVELHEGAEGQADARDEPVEELEVVDAG